MSGLLVFRSMAEAQRAGFELYDRTPTGALVRAKTADGWGLAIVEDPKEGLRNADRR